jgi:predicted acetyltransferase
MALEVRACRPEEQLAGLTPIFHYFGATPKPEYVERFSRIQPPERLHAAFEDGKAVGGAGAFPFRMTVPGAQIPAAGVTTVGVLPTHRRRGVLTAMMRAQLDDLHERGEAIGVLWASEDMIYGRYGYGMASFAGGIDLARERARFAQPSEPVGHIRLVSLDDALDAFPAIYDRVAPTIPGMFTRTRDWWEGRRLSDSPERRDGGGEHVRALLEVDGEPAGYAIYRIHMKFERGVSAAFVNVLESMGITPVAVREVWRFLLGIDWMASIRAGLLPIDHPLFFLLAEPRRMRFRVGDGLWVRLVEVGAALSSRSYLADGAVVFDVADAFCPWNAGLWKLEDGKATRTGEEADMRLDISALGSVYLGGFTFAQLARAGRVAELREGAISRADTLFRAARAPWCPEVF